MEPWITIIFYGTHITGTENTFKIMKIYVASSWRNEYQPSVVDALKAVGHEVYDFRNPAPGENGFAWSDIDPNWEKWSPNEWRRNLEHPIALSRT